MSTEPTRTTSHARAIALLTDKRSYYLQEVERFKRQAKLRQGQLDRPHADHKFINQLLAQDEASIEKYRAWANALGRSIAILEAEQEQGE